LPEHRGLYYGGGWHTSHSERPIDVTSPSTGESLGCVFDADATDVDLAVRAARDGFALWRDTPARERARAV